MWVIISVEFVLSIPKQINSRSEYFICDKLVTFSSLSLLISKPTKKL